MMSILKTQRTILTYVLISLACFCALFFLYRTFLSPPISSPHTSSKPEPLSFKLLDNTIITEASLKGKVVLINFWATWCGPCRIEMPELVALKNSYKHLPFEIIGISVDDTSTDIQNFVTSYSINFPIARISPAIVREFGQLSSIPTTFILNKEFNVVHILKGYHPQHTIQSIIDPLISNGD